MKKNQINTIKKNKDELYTPRILAESIIHYIPKKSIIWCPFDTEKSEIVKAMKKNDCEVIATHIDTGHDFFYYEPEKYDYIVSNPPFSKKLAILKRVYRLNKQFALIFGIPMLNYQEIGEFFLDKEIQLLIPDKRVSFDGGGSSFNCSWFCKGILPKDLMFVHLDHNNTGKYYEPSEMYTEKFNNNLFNL